ncbi:hypothetical protein H5410_036570 [Solanum commersonii]|uniref:Uncharacterized protein n=1 Tax=Solanum commersonii TaxID=4109 RepID=A0A9J5Y5P2_SOLCO|nr:hypothetical protein H5410_036570 [Solanum commersonii]
MVEAWLKIQCSSRFRRTFICSPSLEIHVYLPLIKTKIVRWIHPPTGVYRCNIDVSFEYKTRVRVIAFCIKMRRGIWCMQNLKGLQKIQFWRMRSWKLRRIAWEVRPIKQQIRIMEWKWFILSDKETTLLIYLLNHLFVLQELSEYNIITFRIYHRRLGQYFN